MADWFAQYEDKMIVKLKTIRITQFSLSFVIKNSHVGCLEQMDLFNYVLKNACDIYVVQCNRNLLDWSYTMESYFLIQSKWVIRKKTEVN